jgi:hypothetical protein
MKLRPIGRVKIRKGGWNPKRGEPTLIVAVPKQVKLFFNVEAGQIVEVFVDEENKRIVYQLLQ